MGTFQFLQQRSDERETINDWFDTSTKMSNLNLVTVVGNNITMLHICWNTINNLWRKKIFLS